MVSCLSSMLTTVSTFSLEGEKRGAEREQWRACAREQLVTVTAQWKGLLQCHGDNRGPGHMILASDTQLSPLPSRTWVRGDTLAAGLQELCPDAESNPWLWSWYSQRRAGSQQDSFVNTWDCFLPLTGFSSLLLCNLLQNSPLWVPTDTKRNAEALPVPQPWRRRGARLHVCVCKAKLLSLRCLSDSGSLAEGTMAQPQTEPKSSALERACGTNGAGGV